MVGVSETQLARLARPFPERFVAEVDGERYVPHGVVMQWLLGVLGPVSFEVVEVVRGDLPARPPDPKGRSRRAREGSPALAGVVVGVLARLSAVVDGREVAVCEVGDTGDPANWAHDGERAKVAASDALKRCAARLGLGLHLWVKPGEYVLRERLTAEGDQEEVEAATS
jgi:hypothetical protein